MDTYPDPSPPSLMQGDDGDDIHMMMAGVYGDDIHMMMAGVYGCRLMMTNRTMTDDTERSNRARR
jgi:hypothetical protein